SNEDVWHVKHLYPYKTVARFTEDLDFLLKWYSPISLADLIAHVRSGQTLPESAFHLTFDDGFREMADVFAPILNAKGIPATFFVNSDFVDNAKLCYLNQASVLVELLRQRPSESVRQSVLNVLRGRNIVRDTAEAAILAVRYRDRDVLDEVARVANI